jgi:hypothetical protein
MPYHSCAAKWMWIGKTEAESSERWKPNGRSSVKIHARFRKVQYYRYLGVLDG